jgi:hypothetical protein
MTKQIVIANRKDFRLLLAEKVVQFSAFNDPTFVAALRELKHGCCVITLPTGKLEGLRYLCILMS